MFRSLLRAPNSGVSSRSKNLLSGPSVLTIAYNECEKNPFHPTRNPTGKLNLGTAQNHLVWDVLEPKLSGPRCLSPQDADYDGFQGGSTHFRKDVAEFLGKYITKRPMSPNNVVVSSGSSALFDMMSHALCEEGEGIIIPCPMFGGFATDLETRAHVKVLPAHMDHDKGYPLETEPIEEAAKSAEEKGIKPRAILLTTPHNPLGRIYGRDALAKVLQFAKERQLDVISDEIYACSVFGENARHNSVWDVMHEVAPEMKERVHLIYGFAKDFALSGFKTGVFYTESQPLLSAMKSLSYFTSVSTDTQHMLSILLEDPHFVDELFATHRARIGHAYKVLTTELDKYRIKYTPAEAGFFLWLDLRSALKENSVEGEKELYSRLVDIGGINITPGFSSNSKLHGFFRLCYAEKDEILIEGVRRIASVVHAVPQTR